MPGFFTLMRAAVLHTISDMRVEEVDTPRIGAAEFELIIRKELTLKGSWLNYSAPFPGWEWEHGLEMLNQGPG